MCALNSCVVAAFIASDPGTPEAAQYLWLLFTKGTEGVCGGVEEICVGFQQWSVAGSEAREEDRDRTVANGHAIFGPGEPAIHLHCPRISLWWICKLAVGEGSRRGIGDGPRRVDGG